jgi:hypothetical protein
VGRNFIRQIPTTVFSHREMAYFFAGNTDIFLGECISLAQKVISPSKNDFRRPAA